MTSQKIITQIIKLKYMNNNIFNANYRNAHLKEVKDITIDDLNFQAYRPLESVNIVPNPPGTFSHPMPRFNY